MKIVVQPNGAVEVDVHDAIEAAAFIKALQHEKPKRHRQPKKPRLELVSTEESLSPALVETWNWLVANDHGDGVTPNDIAVGLELLPATANYRLARLRERELAHRVSPGRYRAGAA